MDIETASVEDLVGLYTRATDTAAAIRADAKDKAGKADAIAAKAKLALLARLDAVGAKTLSGPYGRITATERTSVSAKPGEWDAFFAWARELNAPEMVQKRPAVKAVREWMETNGGTAPPGIAVRTERSVSVYKGGSTHV